jgi:cytochrome P450
MTPSCPHTDRSLTFNHHSPEFAEHARELYNELRSTCPVAWSDANDGYWVATSHATVTGAIRNAAAFSSRRDIPDGPFKGTSIPKKYEASVKQGIVELDPPELGPVRRLMMPFFSPTAVAAMKPKINEFTTWCIDQVIESGSCELIESIAGPVPSMLTMTMLGLPLDDWKPYAEVMHKMIYTPPASAERAAVLDLHAWVTKRFHELAEERRANPITNDLVSLIATLERDGELLPIDEVVGNINLVTVGGTDTTTSLIANTVHYLHQNHDQRAWLQEDTSRIEPACEEFLRYFAPVQGSARTVATQCTLGDATLEAHDRIWASYAAANLDPELFENPNEVILDRAPNRHVTFGVGPHRCLGNYVARAIWTEAITQILTRLPDFVVDAGAAVRYPTKGIIDGWVEMPITFTPGQPSHQDTALFR